MALHRQLPTAGGGREFLMRSARRKARRTGMEWRPRSFRTALPYFIEALVALAGCTMRAMSGSGAMWPDVCP
jgi:hypothetical protein